MRISDWSSDVCSSDLPGVMVTGALIGTRRLYDFCHRNKGVRLHPLSHTHSSATLSRLSRFISLTSAIEVDLSGQVNAESAGGWYLGRSAARRVGKECVSTCRPRLSRDH